MRDTCVTTTAVHDGYGSVRRLRQCATGARQVRDRCATGARQVRDACARRVCVCSTFFTAVSRKRLSTLNLFENQVFEKQNRLHPPLVLWLGGFEPLSVHGQNGLEIKLERRHFVFSIPVGFFFQLKMNFSTTISRDNPEQLFVVDIIVVLADVIITFDKRNAVLVHLEKSADSEVENHGESFVDRDDFEFVLVE